MNTEDNVRKRLFFIKFPLTLHPRNQRDELVDAAKAGDMVEIGK